MLRNGFNKASNKFDNISKLAEFWHVKQAFIGVRLLS